jgi:ribose 5-phosphate isomerase B
MFMKIAIGSDHAGFGYKTEVKGHLANTGHEVVDHGTFTDASCDYPDYAHAVALAVEKGEADFGVLICGSANGVCMTANKHAGIRAALCWEKEIAVLARSHNNANVICLPARFVSIEAAIEMADVFIATAFEGGRHQNRVNKI